MGGGYASHNLIPAEELSSTEFNAVCLFVRYFY